MDSMIFKIYFPNIYEILIIRAFPLFLSCAAFENIFKFFIQVLYKPDYLFIMKITADGKRFLISILLL